MSHMRKEHVSKTSSLYLYIIVPIISLLGCRGTSCDNLPPFTSYDQATDVIQSSRWEVEESQSTTKSSWIKRISYYSCDGSSGFLLVELKSGDDYLYTGVPLSVWNEFKEADSYGSYYSRNIKGRYILRI